MAIIGAGGGGKDQIEAFKALDDCFNVVAICDADPERARAAGERFGVNAITQDFGALCEDRNVDIISVCTPPHLHREQILHALRAGKNVICEKPVAGSLKQIDELTQAEAESPGWVMPIFQYRYGRGFQKLKRLVNLGLAGKPYLATSETAWHRDSEYYATPWRGKWETELGGTMLSHAIHAIDMITYILGDADSLYAFSDTRVNQIEVEDCVAAAIRLKSGALATVAVTLGSYEQISRLRFVLAG